MCGGPVQAAVRDPAEGVKPNCISLFQDVECIHKRREIHHKICCDTKFDVMCFNVRGDINLGNMMRTSCLMGCKHFYLCGRKVWDKRFSVGAHHYMSVEFVPNIFSMTINTHHPIDCVCGTCKIVDVDAFCDFLINGSWRPVFVEQGGISVFDPSWKILDDDNRVLLIFGNESSGIPQHVIRSVKQLIPSACVVNVPQMGMMRSHNVATTCSIVLWELNRKMMQQFST